MALPCGAPEVGRKTPSTWQNLICVPAAPPGPGSTGDLTAWLDAWLRHERATMEDRHREMLSQIRGVVSDELGSSFKDAGTRVQTFQEAPPGAIVEKSLVELSRRIQFSNEQTQGLTSELRSTRSEVGALRGTIENIVSMHQQVAPHEHTDEFPHQNPPAAVVPHEVQQAEKHEPTPQKEASRSSTRRSYDSGALKAFNDTKLSDATPEDDPRYNSCYMRFVRFVERESFEVFFGVLIILSAAALSLELQYDSFNTGYEISFPGYDRVKEKEWPWAADTFKWMERCFTVLFTLELVMRMCAMRHHIFFDKWMYLDMFVVIFSIFALFKGSPISMNVMILRVLRVARMVRILRIVRYIRFFDSLYLMMRSLQASMSALLWSFLLLFLIQTVTAMILCSFISDWLVDNYDEAVNKKVFEYYGTFTRTMLTMFEIMMANWIAPARILVNGVSETWSLFFLFYRCMLGFALLAVISAVFIHETMKVANTDDELAVFLAQRDTQIYANKIRQAFMELDDSGDGYVCWQELGQIMEDEVMKNWMKSMQIDTSQVKNLFTLLDDGDGRISYEEFMSGINKVKGAAKSIDVVMVLKVLNQVNRKLDKLRPTGNAK